MKKSIFLFSGITAGLIFIFLGIFDNQKLDKTQSNIIALVNDHPILQSDLDLALSALAMNKENSINDVLSLLSVIMSNFSIFNFKK